MATREFFCDDELSAATAERYRQTNVVQQLSHVTHAVHPTPGVIPMPASPARRFI
jgi:hypothetical protein